MQTLATLATHRRVTGLRLADTGGGELDRDAALADVRAGKRVRLELDAVVYLQGEAPNRNYVRFAPGAIRALAKSFVGAPLQRNHSHDVEDRGGTVLRSEATKLPDGTYELHQTIELVTPWAVEAALLGTLDRFSIGFRATGPVTCTACGDEMFAGACRHWPGEEVLSRAGEKRHVEAVFTSAEGLETSAVSVPAVPGTGIEEIRQALSVARRGDPMLEKIATALGLADGATPDESVTAVVRLKAEHETLSTKLAASDAALAETKAALAAAREELEGHLKAKLAAEIDALVEKAVGEGRVRPRLGADGQREATAVEKAIRRMAETLGVEAAREYVTELPVLLPVGGGALSEASAPSKAQERGLIDETQRRINRQLGLDDDTFRKFNEGAA